MKRKVCSVLLALCMVLTLLPTVALAAGPTYGDTEGHWAEEAIERWSGHRIVQGSNGSFDPNGSLTRGQMAVILCRLLNLPEAPSAGFKDVDRDAWYADAIDRCAAAGIMLGSDGKAMPNEPISREQSIVMLCRALNIEPVENPDLSKYADADQISDYAKGYVAAMIEAGIINGVTDDTVAPQDEINRASTVTILDRAIIIYADEPGQTVEANGGIVIVAADDVTVTGTAGSVIVAAPEGNVTLSNVTTETVTVTSEGGSVTLSNSTVGSVNVNAEDTTVATTGTTTVETVNVGESAEGTTVSAGRGTTVSEVANSAEGTTVTGAGKVESVGSDTDVTVETKGTEVENTGDSSIAVTDKNGKESNVTSGDSSTVTNTTTSSGGSSSSGSSGGSSAPSHTHSWAEEWSKNDTHHWHNCNAANCTVSADSEKDGYAEHTYGEDGDALTCSVCGAYNTAKYAAKIGDIGYETLKAAIEAVTTSGTETTIITLLADVTNAEGMSVGSGKNFTIDFGGHTYTVNKPGEGSVNTKTAGFHLEKDSTITFKNGTLNVSSDNLTAATTGKNIKHLFQTYANLTLDNMTVDGTNLYNDNVQTVYAMSTGHGNIIINNTTIKAASGDVAFDVCSFDSYTGSRITVKGSSVIEGDIEVGQYSNANVDNLKLTIESGTFKGTIKKVGSTTDELMASTVTIKSGSFTDINTALKYAADNATVTILKGSADSVAVTQVPAGNNVTIKAAEDVVVSKVGGGHWNKSTTFDGLHFENGVGLSLTAYDGEVSYKVINCTFKNVTATAWKEGVISLRKDGGAREGTAITATVSGNTIEVVKNKMEGDDRISTYGEQSDGIYIGGTVNATVTNNIIKDVDGTGIYVSGTGEFTITGNTISEWGTGAKAQNEGRAIRTDGGSTVTITGNKMLDTYSHEQYIKSTNCTTLNVSGNYWGGHNPTDSGVYEGISDATLTDYYSDAEMRVLMPIGGLPSTTPASTGTGEGNTASTGTGGIDNPTSNSDPDIAGVGSLTTGESDE